MTLTQHLMLIALLTIYVSRNVTYQPKLAFKIFQKTRRNHNIQITHIRSLYPTINQDLIVCHIITKKASVIL